MSDGSPGSKISAQLTGFGKCSRAKGRQVTAFSEIDLDVHEGEYVGHRRARAGVESLRSFAASPGWRAPRLAPSP